MKPSAKNELWPWRGKLITVCSVCKRVKTSTGKWIIMGLGTDRRVSHGFCPPCARDWREQAGKVGK